MKILFSFICIFFSFCVQAQLPSETDSRALSIEVDDAKLFCRMMGKGKPLVVLHGGPGLSQDYLLPQMSRLAEHHLVIFYDQRGCGYSTGAENPDSIEMKVFIEDLEGLRKSLGLEKISILGHSWGGLLAMHYAIAHPHSIDKLILLNTIPASSEEFSLFLKEWSHRMAPFQDELKTIRESQAFEDGDPETVAHYYRIIFRTYCYHSADADQLSLLMTQRAVLSGFKVADLFRKRFLLHPFNLHPALQQLSLPTLIIHGDSDPIPFLTAENIHTSIPHSQWILIKQCGHFPYVEQPDFLFSCLQQFLHL